MRQRLNDGFGIIELLVIIAIVVVLGVLGFIAYKSWFQPSLENNSVSDAQKRDAQSTVQAFYAAYTDSQGKGAEILQQYGTAHLIAASKSGSKSYSPIVCATNVAPVSTGGVTYGNGHFSVPVTLRFSAPLTFTAEVVKVGNSFKIDKVDCPKQTGGE